MNRISSRICVAVLVIDALTLVAVAANGRGPWRVALALLFSLTVPGAAVVAHRAPRDPVGAAALMVALSWAITILVNDAAIEVGWWHPNAVLFAIGVVSAAAIVVRLRQDAGLRSHQVAL
jgi:hypothetical protein